LFSGGCFGPSQPRPSTSFYTLDYDIPQPNNLPLLPVHLRVGKFSVSPNYNSTRMYYGEDEFTRNSYEYHQWRANPADLVSFFLTRDLRESTLFQGVFGYEIRVKPTHTVEGVVSQFYEKDTAKNWQAILDVNITLIANNSNNMNETILFQKSYTAAKTCARKNPASFVEAMSSAMREISEQISMDIYNTIVPRNP
jgi:cholesterol transport system auxiliary component